MANLRPALITSETLLISESKHDEILRILGSKLAKKVANRHQGGENADKGADFEIRFAVYLMAKHSESPGATMAKQVFELVDDLQVVGMDSADLTKTKLDYQIKDRKELGWKEIGDDFENQQKLNCGRGYPESKQIIVVSRSEIAEKLQAEVPEAIQGHTDVEIFPPWSPNRLLLECSGVRLAVSALCAFPEQTDKLEHVFDMLSSVWLKQERDSRILISDLVTSAREINPSYMRVAGDWSVPSDAQDVLDSIEGFQYEISNGFFAWSYKLTDSGQLPYGCDDVRFIKFTDFVVSDKPAKFEDLEKLLLS